MSLFLNLEMVGCTNIYDTVKEASEITKKLLIPVKFKFSGIIVSVDPLYQLESKDIVYDRFQKNCLKHIDFK